jgi:hypothetical protein
MRAPEVSMASKSAALYNPPVKPQRAFDLDYPKGAPTDAAGKLTHTIDGDPITAKYVVGRTAAGGADVALPREALDEIAKALTGRGALAFPEGNAPHGVSGAYRRGNDGGGLRRTILYDSRLPPGRETDAVISHEIGHALDDMAGKTVGVDRAGPYGANPQSSGLKKELSRVYNDLNTSPSDARMLRQERTGEHMPARAKGLSAEIRAPARAKGASNQPGHIFPSARPRAKELRRCRAIRRRRDPYTSVNSNT